MRAPVVLFVYNRPWHTSQTIEALRKNLLADETDLFIFSDAPKVTGNPDKDLKNTSLVAEVRDLIKTVTRFKSVTVKQHTDNLGLANSVISGVTEVLNQYGKIIVMEDDLVSSPYFLRYMNNSLDHYQNEPRVFNVSAFSFPSSILQIPSNYMYDTYFSYRNSSWGWGTWKDRWDKAIWDHKEIEKLVKDEMIQLEFNKGGDDLTPMLLDQLEGRIDSWSIRWSFSISYHKGLSLTPIYSYINNIGLDGTGVHCGEMGDIYKNDITLSKLNVVYPKSIQLDNEIIRRFAQCYGEMPILLYDTKIEMHYNFNHISIKNLSEFVKKIIKRSIKKIILYTPIINKYYSRQVTLINELQNNNMRLIDKNNELTDKNNELTDKNNKLLTELATLTYNDLSRNNRNIGKYIVDNITISNKLKNILEINTHSNQGGAAKVAHRLCDFLNKRHYNCKMLVSESTGKSEDVILLEKDNSPKQKHLLEFQNKEGWLDFFHLASLNIPDMECFKTADIVHLHNLHGFYFSYFALPELSSLKPVVWTLHDMQAITGHCAHSFECEKWRTGCGDCPDLTIYPAIAKDSTNFIWQNKKNVYQNSNFIIVTPSQWLKNKVENSILASHDTKLIYNGVDEKVFQNIDKTIARNQLHLPADKRILLFTADSGLNNPWKGSQYLLDAYSILKDNENLLFINIGGSADKESNNWMDVSYIQDEKTMALYYSAADLFIYPSLADNCPLVVLESLSCGTPVVSFKTGGIPELIEHSNTGYVAEYKSLNDFINGIKMFIDNDTLRRKASIEGRRAVERKFKIDTMVDNYLKVYEEEFNNFQLRFK